MKYLPDQDSTIAKLIKLERERQQNTLMMIPSENTASSAVEEAVGSSLGNKYAEGYPHHRYYQGQQYVDEVEILAQERAKKLFGVPHVNVQPYSGSPANLEILMALAEPGETIMGLALSSGGHLTHGASASVTSRVFESVQYSVTTGGFLDYENIRSLAKRAKPKVIIAGTTAYSRIIDWSKFAKIAQEVDAYLLTDVSHVAGLIAGGVYPSPVPYADVIMTTTHKSLRGPRGAMIMVTDHGISRNPDLPKLIDKSVFPGMQGGPHMNTIAGIAVALREASRSSFARYASMIVANARALCQELEKRDYQIVSGGTDSHLLVIDVRHTNLLGNTVAEACEAVGIIFNYNSVPFDPNPPMYPSGVRIGTPGITSRGMKPADMKIIAAAIDATIQHVAATKKRLKMPDIAERKRANRMQLYKSCRTLTDIRATIQALCDKYPLRNTYS